MRKLLALLLLLVAPVAFGQQVYTPLDPVVEQTYTVVKEQETIPLQNINQSGGTPLTLYDDGVTYEPIPLQFDFYYFGNLYDSVYISQNGLISFTSNANGCCNGNQLPYLSENAYYNLNNSIFAMWSDLADFNTPGNPYYKSTGNSFTVGWYGVEELGSARQDCLFNVLGLPFFCTYSPPNKFDFEISLFSDSSFSINYGGFDYHNQTGRMFTSGYQGDDETEFHQIYYGNQPQSLQNTTYNIFSSELVPIEVQTPSVDCVQQPLSPSCVLTTLNIGSTDTTTVIDTPIVSSTPTQSSTTEIVSNTSGGVESFSEQERVTASDPVAASTPTAADPVAAVVAIATPDNPLASTPGTQAAFRELTDEEKAAILADAISKNVIEGALTTIASTSAASASNGSQDGSTSTTTTKKETSVDNVTDSSVMIAENNQSAQTETQDTSGGLEILETGRVKAQESIAATMAATENSANDSINQAESIAANSAAVSAANNGEELINSAAFSNVTDSGQTAADASAVESVAQAEAVALASIESSKPSQSAFDDGSNADADLVNTMIDPALAMANATGTTQSIANLEILGVIGGSKPEEKSDAEKRAAEVVAANQQQMEEINKNYMEADQSGIVAAMGADTDVNSYRSAMLSDAAQWYRDKDIYKGIIIKDNVRGSYFLEKGNTDIYKKMIEQQYR